LIPLDEGFGIENASFRWNHRPDFTPAAGEYVPASGVYSPLDIQADTQDHRFELQDISVNFPEKKLSVVTGPTARFAPSRI
jgi:hypothetical protein